VSGSSVIKLSIVLSIAVFAEYIRKFAYLDPILNVKNAG